VTHFVVIHSTVNCSNYFNVVFELITTPKSSEV